MREFHAVIKTYASLVGLRLVSFGLAAAFLTLIAIFVPAAEFGRYSLVLSVVLVIGTGLLSFGNHALLRFAREEFKTNGSVSRALGTRLVIHGVLTLAALLAVWLIHPVLVARIGIPTGSFGLIALALLVVPANEMATFTAQAVGRYTGFGLGPVVLRLGQLTFISLIYVFALISWKALMIATLAGYAACAAVSWSRVPRQALRNLRASSYDLRRFGSFSWSLPFGSASVVLMDWMDLWFIQHFLGTASVGVYAWVYNISLMARALLTPLGALIAPLLIDLSVSGDTAAMTRIMRVSQSLALLVVASIPAISGLFIVAASVLDLGDYQAGVAAATILIAGGAFQLGVTFWYPMILARERLVARGTLVLILGSTLNALGNWFLIPLVGMPGAAFATALAMSFNMLGFLFVIRRHFAIDEGPSLLATVIFAVVILAGVGISALMPMIPGVLLCLLSAAIPLVIGRRLGFYNGLSELRLARIEDGQGNLKRLTGRALVWLSTDRVERH